MTPNNEDASSIKIARFEFGLCASRGARNYQEDTASVWQPASGSTPNGLDGVLVAVLADGMGGHAGGALASRLVCETFVTAFTQDAHDLRDRMGRALDAANRRLFDTVRIDPSLSGMGSTLVGAVFDASGLSWVSVGDSPLYLYRRVEIALLNEDHSLAPALDRLAAEGQITMAQARNDHRRHMLRSAVTGEELELIDISRAPLPMQPGDYVIVSSDGIHTLDTNEIARIVSAYGADGPQAVADALVRAVDNAREVHQDNTTVVVVRLTP